MKKLFAVLIIMGILISAYAPTAQAILIGTEEVSLTKASSYDSNTLQEIENLESQHPGLINYIRNEIKKGNTVIYLYDWNIPYDSSITTKLMLYLFSYYLSDINYFNTIGLSSLNKTIYHITIKTDFTKEQILTAIDKIEENTNKLTSDLKQLNDVEKALIIHDRLIQKCSYDQNKLSNEHYAATSYSTYGALVLHTAVCAGYASAYKALLNKAGIEAYICTSESMNHAWNIVTVNGKKYHVDCTWDDYDMHIAYGYVRHANFLRSTQGIISTGHAADIDSTPTDTTYDSGQFWSSLKKGIQCINGTMYYPKTIYKEGTYLMSVKDFQYSEKACKIDGNYDKVASDGKYYYYNTLNNIKKVDVNTGTVSTIYTTSDEIAGFKLTDNIITMDLGLIDEYYTLDYRSTHTVKFTLPMQYTITFSGASVTKILYNNELYGELPVLGKDGYDFIGWFDEDNNLITPETPFTKNKDLVLYPRFEERIELKSDVPAVLDKSDNLLILSELCDIPSLFISDNIQLTGSGSTGSSVTAGSKTFIVVLKGDLDGDGLIDARDSVYTECLIDQMIDSDPMYQSAADFNCDGNIDEEDLEIITNKGLFINN